MKANNNIFIVCDRVVKDFARGLAPDAPLLEITADEEHKNIESVCAICRWLLEHGANRNAIVYAVGGGNTSDIVGFAASIYKRGVKYINYPTTLLAQIDASIGGKTGVNLDHYKNILGVIRMPADTRIFPEVLKSLPERDLRSGAAELLKTFIIKDKKLYEKAVEVLSSKQIDFEALAPLIKAAAKIKSEIVRLDPYEENLRRILNLGHSYAHAIEWHQGNLSHGEAVAIGIIRAAEISETLGVAKKPIVNKLREDFKKCGLPTELPCSEEELSKAIWKDKKVENGKIHFVLIKEIGKVVIEDLSTLPTIDVSSAT